MCVFHVTRISKNGVTTAVIWTDRKNWWLEQDQGKIVSSFSGDGAYYSHTYLEFGSRLIVCIECIFTTKCVEWYTNWPLCIDLDAHSANFLLQHFRIRNFRPKLKSRLTFLWRWSHFRKLKKDSNFLWNKVLQKRIILRARIPTYYTQKLLIGTVLVGWRSIPKGALKIPFM